jgi:hypothetical protein
MSAIADPVPVILPSDWYIFHVIDGVDIDRPGIYQWKIEGSGSYIGKYGHISRPTKRYGWNVSRMLNGKPPSSGNPQFRRVHHALLKAHKDKKRIELIILENVSPDRINQRERDLITQLCGNLND